MFTITGTPAVAEKKAGSGTLAEHASGREVTESMTETELLGEASIDDAVESSCLGIPAPYSVFSYPSAVHHHRCTIIVHHYVSVERMFTSGSVRLRM